MAGGPLAAGSCESGAGSVAMIPPWGIRRVRAAVGVYRQATPWPDGRSTGRPVHPRPARHPAADPGAPPDLAVLVPLRAGSHRRRHTQASRQDPCGPVAVTGRSLRLMIYSAPARIPTDLP